MDEHTGPVEMNFPYRFLGARMSPSIVDILDDDDLEDNTSLKKAQFRGFPPMDDMRVILDGLLGSEEIKAFHYWERQLTSKGLESLLDEEFYGSFSELRRFSIVTARDCFTAIDKFSESMFNRDLTKGNTDNKMYNALARLAIAPVIKQLVYRYRGYAEWDRAVAAARLAAGNLLTLISEKRRSGRNVGDMIASINTAVNLIHTGTSLGEGNLIESWVARGKDRGPMHAMMITTDVLGRKDYYEVDAPSRLLIADDVDHSGLKEVLQDLTDGKYLETFRQVTAIIFPQMNREFWPMFVRNPKYKPDSFQDVVRDKDGFIVDHPRARGDGPTFTKKETQIAPYVIEFYVPKGTGPAAIKEAQSHIAYSLDASVMEEYLTPPAPEASPIVVGSAPYVTFNIAIPASKIVKLAWKLKTRGVPVFNALVLQLTGDMNAWENRKIAR
jgi:hypothetical protein